MRPIVFIFLLLISIPAYSQIVDLKADYEKAKQLFEDGDYTGTVAALEKLIPEVAKVYEDTASFYEMHNMMGMSLAELKKFSQAEQYFNKTIAFYTSNPAQVNHYNNFTAQVSLAQIYYGLNNFGRAENYFRNALVVERNTNGENTADYITILQNLANTCLNAFKLKTADSIYVRLLDIKKATYGEKSLEYASTLKALGDLQKGSGKTSDAENNYVIAKKIIKDSLGAKHKDYLNILSSLASMYKQKQKLAEAEAYYNEMIEIYRADNDVKSPDYIACINNLALLYKSQNKYAQAELLLKKNLDNYKKSVGEKHILYITTLRSMGDLYRGMGQYNKAESMYNESQKLMLENMGEKNQDYANLLNNLAILYEETGRYDLADANFTQSLRITRDVLSDKHPDYATTLNNMALLYKNMGHYEQAEPMYKQALAIRKESLGENHPEYGASLNNLADFYEHLGRLKDAEPLYIKATQIAKTVYGEKHHEYAVSLNNLASLYEDNKQFDKALQLYNQSLQIHKEVLGEAHPEYASTLNNLAFLYFETGKFTEAENLYKKDLDIIRNSLGTNHPNYAKTLSNLADLYENMARYAEAEKNYLEAARIRKDLLGEYHPEYTFTLANLARVYTATGKYQDAFRNWQIVISNYKQEIKKYFPSMSEKEKEEFYNKFKDRFEQYNSFATLRYGQDPNVLSEMYNTQLATKALLLNSSNKVRQRILNSGDPKLIDLFKKWQSDKELLAQIYTLPKNEVSINQDSLERKVNDLEKELSLKSELFKSANDIQTFTWQDVQKVLRPGEAAIEIISFRKYKADKGGTYVKYKFEDQKEKDSLYYAALIITPETKNNPEIVLMKNGTDLTLRFIKYYRNTIKFQIDDEFCYANYWSKIAKALPGVKKVYLSPDGVYNQINLLSIVNPATKKFIIDEIEIQTVTNTKDLLTIKPIGSASKKVFLLGDPEFGGTGVANTRAGATLNRLPGSGVEVKKIDNIMKANNWASSLYTGAQSTEEAIKTVADVKILHVATHGYFDKDGDAGGTKEAKVNDNPLLKSGLFMAAPLKTSTEDGILTSYEAMNLNLDNTDLVVLSACETGLGEVINGEGVYGLQRAFRVAGARSLIFSLWKVDDETTQKLMTYFYENWLKTGNKRQAFSDAQNKLRQEYPAPYYWGAFVLIGE